MEGDEIEMTMGELQKYVREMAKTKLISTDTLEKCKLLQTLLDRREKQSAHLLKLCESVAACEAIVKKQYSLLGWEYKNTDSDDDGDDDNKTGFGNTPSSPCQFVHSETQIPSSPTDGRTPLSSKLGESENLERDRGKKIIINLKRQPVVVLTRIPLSKIRSLCQPTPQSHESEDKTLNSSDSDELWELDDDSSDSDYSISSYNTGSNKRRKMDQKNEKLTKSHASPQASKNTGAKSKVAKTSTPQANANTNAKSNTMKTKTPPANTKGVSPVCMVSTPSQLSTKATKTQDPPSVQQEKIIVNMNVLARGKTMDWKKGKILEKVTKDGGELKYKISFEDKERSVVSGHHIAFDRMPKPGQLFVGARVVAKREAEKPLYCPGFVAELPDRKNRMRFLVFLDDHTPVYVGLPSLFLVCRPLPDPLDDIVDDTHKNFMKEYIKVWPYPPQTQYRVGQMVNAELNGVQQRCEVQAVDSSLIHVVFQKNQHMEWIYRGSIRLQHMINMREQLELKRLVEQKKNRLQSK